MAHFDRAPIRGLQLSLRKQTRVEFVEVPKPQAWYLDTPVLPALSAGAEFSLKKCTLLKGVAASRSLDSVVANR
jgi:hypothetical protein